MNTSLYTDLDTQALLDTLQNNQAVLDRLDGLSLGPYEDILQLSSSSAEANSAPGGLPFSKTGGWIKGVGSQDSLGADAGLPGFKAWSGKVLAGMDTRLQGFGVYGGFALYGGRSYVESSGVGSGDVESAGASVYGGVTLGLLRLAGDLSYGLDSLDATRSLGLVGGTATSYHDGQTGGANVMAALPLTLGPVTVMPRAGVELAFLNQGAFIEGGPSNAALSVTAQSDSALQPYAGLALAGTFHIGQVEFVPEAGAGWSDEVQGPPSYQESINGGAESTVQGETPAHTQFSAGAGIGARLGASCSVYADYGVTLPNYNFFAQSVSLGLRWQWMQPMTYQEMTDLTGEDYSAAIRDEAPAGSEADWDARADQFEGQLQSKDYQDAPKQAVDLRRTAPNADDACGLYRRIRRDLVEPLVFDGRYADVEQVLLGIRPLCPGDKGYVQEADGMMEWRQGRYDSAMAHFRAAARLNPSLRYLVRWLETAPRPAVKKPAPAPAPAAGAATATTAPAQAAAAPTTPSARQGQ